MTDTYNVLSIIRGTTVDGPGFRTSIYLSGCTHACPGCHNPQSWSFTGGNPMTLEEIMEIVREEDFNVTLTGGDPLCSPDSTLRLIQALKADNRNIWLYTGYTWEEIIATKPLLPNGTPNHFNNPEHATLYDVVKSVDVVVDGPFIQSLHDPDLLFRGSSNQRLIDVAASLQNLDMSPILYS